MEPCPTAAAVFRTTNVGDIRSPDGNEHKRIIHGESKGICSGAQKESNELAMLGSLF